MKRQRSVSHFASAKLAGCTVSAAALMLGVSHAATVGFNIQATYCAAPTYSGAVVTAPAFGIPMNQWESLTPITTGYGCPCGFTTLSEVIDTTTSDNGLNPLPRGAITVNWGAYAANVSGFGGYDRPGPHYTFSGNGYNPGNEQVYWGFLRDGVNFGPIETNSCGYSPGDNYQPGYNIDITGLKSLFTNSPFAVQLIASSDSLWGLTNAFVIDATANTTQSVYYPSIPTPGDAGGSLFNGDHFPRGIGGGLSTVTLSIDSDHLKIIGNRAQHGIGFNLGSTIAGFIITDKPVISMSPNSVLANSGDGITLNPSVVGVPPMSYQWRKNGQPVSGGTDLSLSITNPVLADAGSYDLVVTNLYGSATSAVAVLTVDHIVLTHGQSYVVDSNPQNPEMDGIDAGASWVASSTDSQSVTRSGVMSFFDALLGNQIQVPVSSSFNSPTGTIMFWMRSGGLLNPAGNPAVLVDRHNGNSGYVILLNADGTISFQAGGNAVLLPSSGPLADNNWHNIAVTYDQTDQGAITLYVDGVFNNYAFFPAWSWAPTQELDLGMSSDVANFQPYHGQLDDVRAYNRILTGTEVASAAGGATVNAGALLLQLNFDAAPIPGVTLQWLSPDSVLQGAPAVTGPYTDMGTGSPRAAAAQGAARFFRYRHVPATVVSNPYMM